MGRKKFFYGAEVLNMLFGDRGPDSILRLNEAGSRGHFVRLGNSYLYKPHPTISGKTQNAQGDT
jgi:hypothetical protein